MAEPLNHLTDEHMSAAEKAALHEWETKILRHLAATPDAPTVVMALQPILARQVQDLGDYYNAIDRLRDRRWIDHRSVTEDGLAELHRREHREQLPSPYRSR